MRAPPSMRGFQIKKYPIVGKAGEAVLEQGQKNLIAVLHAGIG